MFWVWVGLIVYALWLFWMPIVFQLIYKVTMWRYMDADIETWPLFLWLLPPAGLIIFMLVNLTNIQYNIASVILSKIEDKPVEYKDTLLRSSKWMK
jgi:hypothetical protein